jgi:hypothetical protein
MATTIMAIVIMITVAPTIIAMEISVAAATRGITITVAKSMEMVAVATRRPRKTSVRLLATSVRTQDTMLMSVQRRTIMAMAMEVAQSPISGPNSTIFLQSKLMKHLMQ